MTYKSIPPGQLRLYKPLFEAGGLSLEELSRASDCTTSETRNTLGALGNRVTQARGKHHHKPSRLLIRRDDTGIYTLSPTLLEFIANTPSFQKALGSPMKYFFLHSKTACEFIWDDEEIPEGHLQKFPR